MNIKKHLPWLGALLPIINAQADTNPNVVIIYIDDMGIGDIGCYGGKFVATPNIDKLAQDGLLFNQYYSSAPVSSPSRCGLTTGLFPIEVGINTFLNDKASNKRCEQRNYLDDKLPSMVRKAGCGSLHNTGRGRAYSRKNGIHITAGEHAGGRNRSQSRTVC